MLRNLFAFILIIVAAAAAVHAQDEVTPVSNSELASISLPAGAARVNDASIPAEITGSLEKLIAAGGDKVRGGDREVIAWTENYKRSDAAGLIRKITGNLKTAGWAYEIGGQEGELTVFSVVRTTPERRALLGFFMYSDDAFVVAWTEMLRADSAAPAQPVQPAPAADRDDSPADGPAPAASSSARVVTVPKNTTFVNALGNEMPAMPKFPALSPKAGRVRGYVKDAAGKPLAGAAIGVRATAVGGYYSGAQGKTDANGYYEFAIPAGVAHYYNAGYAIDYGDGLAGLGLHPADGSIDSFASPDGAVENFVLLTYGITSRANVSDNPRLPSTYYGGAINVGYWTVSQSDASVYPTGIVEGSVIEVTLTPDGPLVDGSTGRTITVRKTVGFEGNFYINNIPLGRYKISTRMAGGKALKMRLNSPKGTVFGMSPEETTSSATLLFKPGTAQASMAGVAYGGWESVNITVEKP